MALYYHVTGEQRKALVTAVSAFVDAPAVYQNAPTFAYAIGEYRVDKEGTLTGPADEALVTALWVFSDFVLFAFALSAGAGCLRLALGLAPEGLSERHGAFEMRGGRWLIWLCAALAGLTAALIAPDSASLKLFSELVAPGLNLLAIFGLILPALLIGRARRKL